MDVQPVRGQDIPLDSYQLCGKIPDKMPDTVAVRCWPWTKARYVIVQFDNKQPMFLCNVEIHGTSRIPKVDIINPIEAMMISHAELQGPELAIDEDVEGDVKETCAYVPGGGENPWLAVDLGASLTVVHVETWKPKQYSMQRLQTRIGVTDTRPIPGQAVNPWSSYELCDQETGYVTYRGQYSCNTAAWPVGRYVIIQQPVAMAMSICDVKIWGF